MDYRVQSINKPGKKSDIWGKRVTTVSTIRLTARKGKLERLTVPIEVLPILEATKRHTPTGGVVSPIMRLRTAMTAKCIGSTSTVVATFNNMGNKISSAAIVSMKVPMKMSKILINNSTR